MKLKLCATVALIFVTLIPAYSEDSINFENYKKLLQQERQQIVREATPELQKRYGRWDQILSMGGKWWNNQQGEDIINSKGVDALADLGNIQVTLWGDFYFQTVDANKKAGMKDEQAQKAAAIVADNRVIDAERYKDLCWYLVKLAPTPEALALNEKARALGVELNKRFGQGRKITKEDLKTIDAAVKEIRDQMRQLPQWSPDQVEAALANLPEEHYRGRGQGVR
jgi:hypothetical protein